MQRIVLWGTPDVGKPRARILISGLKSQNCVVAECVQNIWGGIEDKSQVKSVQAWLGIALRYFLAYPLLIFRYLRAPRHDVVLVSYMGHLDVLVLWPFAKMRGAKIVWDAFLSLYGTVVEDRKLIGENTILAGVIKLFEHLCCVAADVIILDTNAHADYFRKTYNIKPKKLVSVWVGAETDVFRRIEECRTVKSGGEFRVLFYGQFIPLHGVEHIIEAASRVSDPAIKWTIVGRGQERERIDKLISRLGAPFLKIVDWVNYQELPELIANSDLCLGVFGASDKAARVIPNKVFQILAVGRPLATADTPAIREIVSDDTPGVWLVPPGSGEALAEAVMAAKAWKERGEIGPLYPGIEDRISSRAIARTLMAQLDSAMANNS